MHIHKQNIINEKNTKVVLIEKLAIFRLLGSTIRTNYSDASKVYPAAFLLVHHGAII